MHISKIFKKTTNLVLANQDLTPRHRAWLLMALALLIGLLLGQPALAQPKAVQAKPAPVWTQLIDRLVMDGYAREDMVVLFSRPEVVFMPEVIESKTVPAFKKKFDPPKKKPSTGAVSIYKSMTAPERIAEARAFLRENMTILRAVEIEYGVPKEVLVAIMAVETRLGTFLGQHSAFSTLASLSLATDMNQVLPFFSDRTLTAEQTAWLKTRASGRGEWAYKELKALFAYAEAAQADPVTMPSSIYGAIGICQFMPSSAMKWAVDGNKDNRINLFDLEDAVHSMANFLIINGWKTKARPDQNRKAIMAYNPSVTYTNTVLFLTGLLQTIPEPAPQKDQNKTAKPAS